MSGVTFNYNKDIKLASTLGGITRSNLSMAKGHHKQGLPTTTSTGVICWPIHGWRQFLIILLELGSNSPKSKYTPTPGKQGRQWMAWDQFPILAILAWGNSFRSCRVLVSMVSVGKVVLLPPMWFCKIHFGVLIGARFYFIFRKCFSHLGFEGPADPERCEPSCLTHSKNWNGLINVVNVVKGSGRPAGYWWQL